MLKKIIICLIGSLLWILCNCCEAGILLRDIRITGESSTSRVVLELSNQAPYHAFLLANPDRLVIDLQDTELVTHPSKLNLNNTLIKIIRTAKRDPHTLRVVFDLHHPVTLQTFNLKADQNSYHRLVFDLSSQAKTVENKIVQSSTAVSENSTKSFPSKLKNVVVVIDPGHGGKDPGAIGLRRTQEKDVVLAISQKLKAMLDKQPGMKAVLTRNGDYYISLRQRLSIARKYNADIFIAVHADAYNKQNSFGASVYALSQRGASSEMARWLAEKENHSELGEASLMDKSYLLRFVLLDLSQTATIASSLQLGGEVLSNLGKITRLHHNKIEQAGFVVLKSPDIPSVLIETGFISNPHEELLLCDPVYQQTLVNGIVQGIEKYFWQHPPRNSLMAEKQNIQTY